MRSAPFVILRDSTSVCALKKAEVNIKSQTQPSKKIRFCFGSCLFEPAALNDRRLFRFRGLFSPECSSQNPSKPTVNQDEAAQVYLRLPTPTCADLNELVNHVGDKWAFCVSRKSGRSWGGGGSETEALLLSEAVNFWPVPGFLTHKVSKPLDSIL